MNTSDTQQILNECDIYMWEWDIPARSVRFGVPSLDGLWADDRRKLFKLTTVLERVHPDDIAKIFVSRNSPVYRSDEMFQLDLRLRLHDGVGYEWFCIRGLVIHRDKRGRPTYVHGVAINADQRYRAVMRLIERKTRNADQVRQHIEYFAGMTQQIDDFMASLASNADLLITGGKHETREAWLGRLDSLKVEAERLLELTDQFRSWMVREGVRSGETRENNTSRPLHLWEHLAELQQVYTLQKKGTLRLNLANAYDDLHIVTNVMVLDLLVENMVGAQLNNSRDGELTLSYRRSDVRSIELSVTIDRPVVSDIRQMEGMRSEEALGLSVCRMLAGRMHATVTVRQGLRGQLSYVAVLPMGLRQPVGGWGDVVHTKLSVLGEGEDDAGDKVGAVSAMTGEKPLPDVLIGLPADPGFFRGCNLFNGIVVTSADALLGLVGCRQPDIIFVSDVLPGATSLDDMLVSIRRLYPESALVVVGSTAGRTLHRHVRQLGASYLLAAPLTLRKVNQMLRKYVI